MKWRIRTRSQGRASSRFDGVLRTCPNHPLPGGLRPTAAVANTQAGSDPLSGMTVNGFAAWERRRTAPDRRPLRDIMRRRGSARGPQPVTLDAGATPRPSSAPRDTSSRTVAAFAPRAGALPEVSALRDGSAPTKHASTVRQRRQTSSRCTTGDDTA